MKSVFIGADHRGYKAKEEIERYLMDLGYHVVDLGGVGEGEDDYVDIAIPLAEKCVNDTSCLGILICGSGVGMCVGANKVYGARAGIGFVEKQVRAGRRDDDMNILCLASDVSNVEEMKELCLTFLETKFSPEERYVRRLAKIKKYESSTLR